MSRNTSAYLNREFNSIKKYVREEESDEDESLESDEVGEDKKNSD
jgi:hypothetical protein